MIPVEAQIIRHSKGHLAIEAQCQSGCGSCGVRKICSGSKRSLLLDLSADQEKAWQEGQELEVEIAEEELLRLTLMAYLLPCILLVATALLASPWGDLATALGAVLGLSSGVLISGWMTRRHPPKVFLNPIDRQEPEA